MEKYIHRQEETHLYNGSFSDFIKETLTNTHQEILLITPPENNRKLRNTIKSTVPQSTVTTHTGDQSNLPFETDAFDTAIHYNQSKGILQRHKPLYEVTRVVDQQGIVLYRAPNYIAHSNSTNINSLHILEWENNTTPHICGKFTITQNSETGSNFSTQTKLK